MGNTIISIGNTASAIVATYPYSTTPTTFILNPKYGIEKFWSVGFENIKNHGSRL